MKLKAFVILSIIVLSLIPAYGLYTYLERKMKPRESSVQFVKWLVAVLALIFVYTFLVVFIIRILFPGA